MCLVLTCLIVVPLLLVSCTPESPSQPTPEPSPKGSVIEKNAEWVRGEIYEGYNKLRITARVMNISDEGVIKITARIAEGDVRELPSKSTELYLKKGEEKTITFDFWVKGKFRWSVFCTP